MLKRILVLVTIIATFALLSATVIPGYARDDPPPKEAITTLYRVADIYAGATGSAPEDLVVFSSALYFGANGNDGFGRELWRYTTGTGAERVEDIYAGASSSYPYYLTVYGNALYFGADGNDGTGRELWKYTVAGGAVRVADIRVGATGSDPEHMEVYDGVLYFSADGGDGAGRELWSYDTTHGAQRVADIYSGADGSSPSYLASYNDALFFSADGNDGSGKELWMYDPISGVQRVEDINSSIGSSPKHLAVYSGALYFSASGDEGAGHELWMYDPDNGAQLVADIYPGASGSNPSYLIAYNGALYFSAFGHDNAGTELWKYDPVNGADRVADIYPGVTGSLPAYPAVYNGSLFFQANGNDGAGAELWTYGNSSTIVLRSARTLDGWVLESGEDTGVGGTMNSASVLFNLGDDAADRQYRAILSFNTSVLPDNAVITGVVLAIRQHSLTGADPFTTHGNIRVDIRMGAFGANALEIGDFQAVASRNNVGTLESPPDANNWYMTKLMETAYANINPLGVTQVRLRFQTDDNNDGGADYIKFYSGDIGSVGNRPMLFVIYYVP
jgi:ELWxxDGT repeat protein